MKTYHVIFKNGRTADYTSAVLELLKTDPEVEMIIDNETGEIIE